MSEVQSSQPLPELMDARRIAAELGIPVDAAYKMMEGLPKIRPAGLRKIYVRKSDLLDYLERHTVNA